MPALPAILGGDPMRPEAVPMASPSIEVTGAMGAALVAVLESGQITDGPQVRRFEEEVADFVGVAHAVAVSNCTTGLLLLLRGLGLTGGVILPSFTFIATGHAVLWNGLTPMFADIDTETFTLNPDKITAVPGASAIVAVHTFGVPCDVDVLEKIAASRGIPLVVDAAHGFGGRYGDGSRIGAKATAEVFSFSPTKPLTTGEGGIITTNDGALATELRVARNYGNPGTYDSVSVGLNGRLPELAAVIGRHGLPRLPGWLARRGRCVARYRGNLADLPGITFQQPQNNAQPTYKDLCLVVEPEEFGLSRDQLARALAAERVPTRRYFDPPLHRQSVYESYRGAAASSLDGTEWLAARVLTLPLFSHMPDDLVDQVSAAVRRIHAHAPEVRARLREETAGQKGHPR